MPAVKNPCTPIGRVSFPSVFEPKVWDADKEGKYEITLIFPPDADLSALKAAAREAAAKKWPNGIPKNLDSPFHDCSENDNYDGLEGTYVKFKRGVKNGPPVVVGGNPRDVITAESRRLYAGCYARVTYRAYAYDNASRGVAFALLDVQKTGDGEPFGLTSDPEADFDAVETAEGTVGTDDFFA